MTVSKKQLAERAARLEAAVNAASKRLLDVKTPLAVPVITDVAVTPEWAEEDEQYPLTIRCAAVTKLFKSHRLDSDGIYAPLKLAPELASLVIATRPLCDVALDGWEPLPSALGAEESHDDIPFVFLPLSSEDMVRLHNGNQIRSIIKLVNKAR